MYTVYDTGKKAVLTDRKLGWNACSYAYFEVALEYAKKWLGCYSCCIPDNWDGTSIDYNGYGNTIEIRKE